MQLRRDVNGVLILSINMHGAGDDNVYCELEPASTPIGPVVNFYRHYRTDDGVERRCVLTLSRGGCIGLLRFLPALISESSRLERATRKSRL